jgi:nicotinic acid mononucleotide adenylyltransferase
MIRQRIMNGETISDLVPKGVEQLILEKGYYL